MHFAQTGMTFHTDSISYDAQKIADYQADSHFDYNSQLNMTEYTWFEMLSRWFNRLLNFIFSGRFEEKYTTPVMIALFLIALFIILFFLYRKRPELFMRSKKTPPLAYAVEEENIHEIDFGKEISTALDSGNYRLAIRLIYLHTLRILSDNKLIDWQIHKTPTEYLYEIKNRDVKPPFRELTRHFLQIRYGNYRASIELYETVLAIRKRIRDTIEGGRNEG
ncbi:MAG: DUF4129 domain-containing protein [Tannerella sp.]|jgi:hypothetical protein|nr:DUF4129 domain-containing protein [Tannerella sp.]